MSDILKDLATYQAHNDYVRYALASAGIPFTDEDVAKIYALPYPSTTVDYVIQMHQQSVEVRREVEDAETQTGPPDILPRSEGLPGD